MFESLQALEKGPLLEKEMAPAQRIGAFIHGKWDVHDPGAIKTLEYWLQNSR